MPGARWRGFERCQECGSLERVKSQGGRTAPKLYHHFSQQHGLSVSTILELQKRGLLPRDLDDCTPVSHLVANVVRLALASEDILRAGLSALPKARRERLIHPITSDGLLTGWQRHILGHYVMQYQLQWDRQHTHPREKGKWHGNAMTTTPEMILMLEARYGLSAATTRPWIRKLRKIAYQRVRRGIPKGGTGDE